MKALLLNQEDPKDVIQFSFATEEYRQLEWEDETEFSYKGDMYDVIEKKTEENRLILRCIEDEKETSLLQDYRKNTKRNSSNSSIAQLVTAQFILPVDYSLQQPERIIKRIFGNSSSSLTQTISTVSSPPPDVC